MFTEIKQSFSAQRTILGKEAWTLAKMILSAASAVGLYHAVVGA